MDWHYGGGRNLIVKIFLAILLFPLTVLGFLAGFIARPTWGGFIGGFNYLENLAIVETREELVRREMIRQEILEKELDSE